MIVYFVKNFEGRYYTNSVHKRWSDDIRDAKIFNRLGSARLIQSKNMHSEVPRIFAAEIRMALELENETERAKRLRDKREAEAQKRHAQQEAEKIEALKWQHAEIDWLLKEAGF